MLHATQSPSDQNISQLTDPYKLAESHLSQALAESCLKLLNQLGFREFIINRICPHTQDPIFTGCSIDTVTKITANGNYWYTHNGERSSEQESQNLVSLPVISLQEIHHLLELEITKSESSYAKAVPTASTESEDFDQIQKEYQEAETKFRTILAKRCTEIMEKCSLKKFIIHGIDPLRESTISTGEYTDAVTKVTVDGDYWYTPNGYRSSQEHGGKLTKLPIHSLQEIHELLEDRMAPLENES